MRWIVLPVILTAVAAFPAASSGQSQRGPSRPPVLAFPDPGLDDSAAYAGYRTQFHRDAAGNTVQAYVDRRADRVVHVWADAENESIGFTARDEAGHTPDLTCGQCQSAASRGPGRLRTLQYTLSANVPRLRLGWFLLGSMRVERDFEYVGIQRTPFAGAPYIVPELSALAKQIEALEPAERTATLGALNASDIGTLRARLRPTFAVKSTRATWVARIAQPSADGRDTIVLELRVDPRRVQATHAGDSITFAAIDGSALSFDVTVATTAAPLTPLARADIFTPEFLAFAARQSSDPSAAGRLRARRLERQIRGVELLASREKLLAGMPTYATYFGRDMMVATLMMQPIWRPAVSEAVVGAVLGKLGPRGDVSHEEALGGQATRETASEVAALLKDRRTALERGDAAAASSLLQRATAALREQRRTRENYYMIDDEFQLPVLAARWLTDARVSAEQQRAFLRTQVNGATRAEHLVAELALVAKRTADFARDPVRGNLIAFAPRDGGWGSASWRDSGAGYANGRYAMDVNAIWAPAALQDLGRILSALRTLGLPVEQLARSATRRVGDTTLLRYVADSNALTKAVTTWRGAEAMFVVHRDSAAAAAAIAARVAALPANDRDYWQRHAAAGAAADFLALSLDERGEPIGVANTDPATRLFLEATDARGGHHDAAALAAEARDAALFSQPYPRGLLVAGVGPVVSNDAYAPSTVWPLFERDAYHGSKVVWGREVNLFILGAAARAKSLEKDASQAAMVAALRASIDAVRREVEASGFHAELWSYAVRGGQIGAERYGSSGDLQLWSTTDLAVQFALDQLKR